MHRGFNGTLSNKRHHAIGCTSGRTVLETKEFMWKKAINNSGETTGKFSLFKNMTASVGTHLHEKLLL
jgi:hypothetical protein